jgi:hypothetical protein
MMDYGTKKCKHCQQEFKKRAPVDTYCSIKCNIEAKKLRDAKKEKKPKAIKQFSNKRAKRNAAYLAMRNIFLMEDANQFCPVMRKVFSKTVRATEIHHTNGRENERLTDRMYWLAVSREGHKWIHANPELAREQGWLTKDYKDE